MREQHDENQRERAIKDQECVSCSCCCPFRHATRDEDTGKISILCGNPARSNLGTPSMSR